MKKILLLFLCVSYTFNCFSQSDTVERVFLYYYNQPKGSYGYFRRTDGNEWAEFDCKHNRKKFTFDLVDTAAKSTILYDKSRKLFVRLTDTVCYLGKERNKIYHTDTELFQI